jgi:hypothetical protein
MGSRGNDGSRCNEGVFTDHSAIEDTRLHPEQATVFNGASMHDCIVPDGNVVTKDRRVSRVRNMNDSTILDIGSAAYRNRIHITTYYSVEPDT